MPELDLEQNCAFLLHDTARLIRKRFDEAVRDLELTPAKWRILVLLGKQPGLRQSQLAERLEIEKAPMGSALRWLESAGWLKREADLSDRRARLVKLEAGAAPILEKLDTRFRAVEANYLRGFDQNELAQMRSSLEKIRAQLAPDTATGTSLEVPDSYVSVLFDCARLQKKLFDVRLEELGFSRNQWLLLNTIQRREGLTQTEIAAALEMRLAPLGKLIDSLQNSGWIERRPDKRDRRANCLHLTRRAKHTLGGAKQRYAALHEAIERPLGSHDTRQLIHCLGWIRQRLLEEAAHSGARRRGAARF